LVRSFALEQSQQLEDGDQIPVFALQEVPDELASPVVRNVLLFPIFRTNKEVHVMSQFMIENLCDYQVTEGRRPKRPLRNVLTNPIHV